MATTQITNPKSGRKINVRVWSIDDPKAMLARFRGGLTPKALSWELLSEKHSVKAMEREMDGEAASSNFALSVFEHALDWTLGLTVFNWIVDAAKRGKMPKPFKVAVSRKGDTFIIGASGTVYA